MHKFEKLEQPLFLHIQKEAVPIEIKEQARLLYVEGLKLKEIAERLEVSCDSVKQWSSKGKWKELVSPKNKKWKNESEKEKSLVKKSEKVKKEKINRIDKVVKLATQGSELTEQEKNFCHEYMRLFNVSQAYVNAGYGSLKEARNKGYVLMKRDDIKSYIDELKALYRREDAMDISKVLERHQEVAFYDVKDWLNEDGTVNLDKVDGSLIKKITVKEKDTEYGTERMQMVEFEPRDKSLDVLTKLYGLDGKLEKEQFEHKKRIDEERLKIDDKVVNEESKKQSEALEKVLGVLKNGR